MLSRTVGPYALELRPECPHCRWRMWPYRGLGDEPTYRCLVHGWWMATLDEDEDERAVVALWPYPWREAFP